MAADRSDPVEMQFLLTVESPADGRRWRARLTLQTPEGPVTACEFASPLELARHIARLTLPPTPGSGLR